MLYCNVLHICEHLLQTCSVESFGAFIKFGLIDSLLKIKNENGFFAVGKISERKVKEIDLRFTFLFWRTVLKQKNKGLGLMLSQQRLPQNCATMKSLADSCLLCWIPSTNKMNGIIGNTKLKLYIVQTYYVLLELILLSIGRWLTGQVARYCLALLSINCLYLKKKINRQMTDVLCCFALKWFDEFENCTFQNRLT